MASIHRRSALRVLAGVGAGALIHSAAAQQLPRYSILGSGPVVLAFDRTPAGYYDELARRYRVIVIEYPQGPSQGLIDSWTADRVCNDILAVADQVEAERFAWYGFSWGGVVGLQLATRTSRLTALACGGWPPLGGQYAETLAYTEEEAAQGRTTPALAFYRSIRSWQEREAVSRLTCPRMTFAGSKDEFVAGKSQRIRIGPLIAEHRMELENMGWMVRLVPDLGHELGGRPDIVTPILRAFLDPVLLHG